MEIEETTFYGNRENKTPTDCPVFGSCQLPSPRRLLSSAQVIRGRLTQCPSAGPNDPGFPTPNGATKKQLGGWRKLTSYLHLNSHVSMPVKGLGRYLVRRGAENESISAAGQLAAVERRRSYDSGDPLPPLQTPTA